MDDEDMELAMSLVFRRDTWRVQRYALTTAGQLLEYMLNASINRDSSYRFAEATRWLHANGLVEGARNGCDYVVTERGRQVYALARQQVDLCNADLG